MVFNREQFKYDLLLNVKEQSGKVQKEALTQDFYVALSKTVMGYVSEHWTKTKDTILSNQQKQAFYFSAEFLVGRSLGNNLINFGMFNDVLSVIEELGLDINALEDQERDPGLGNGGLGRLAACFLDSLATLGYPGHGYGLRYRYGMFEQKIENGFQVEKPDNWLEKGDMWEVRRETQMVYVKFGGYVDNVVESSGRIGYRRNDAETVIAIPYDMPIIGYGNNHINTLRLWQAQAPEPFDLNAFNDGNYEAAVRNQNAAENISRVLYPNDNSYRGKELRLRQQYFFTSASLQDIIHHFLSTYGNDQWDLFPQKIAIQLNDTHPVVAIPELMRLLMDWQMLEWDQVWTIVTQVFAYTNHTVLAEALESWDITMFRGVLPRIYQIIEEINRRFTKTLQEKYPNDYAKHQRMSILDHGLIKMAHLAIIGSHKVNGVAVLHTDILKNDVLKEWYELYPEKFLNKTNGITPRRWILKSNPKLSTYLDQKIGTAWHTELSQLTKLLTYEKDNQVLDDLWNIKQANKQRLTNKIQEWTGVELDPNSIFDVQIKRLHEYKRQLLNVLHIISLYHQIKMDSSLDIHPRSFIFGAKAASGYRRAKLIIKLINNIAQVINNDPIVSKKIKVVFIPNYCVSVAEMIFPAADVSEQISTAGKEASGTGNMKFMANGAITLGTLDGANVEILEEVGSENCVIFGATAEEITVLQDSNSYYPQEYYNNNPLLKKSLDSLLDNTFTLGEDPNLFRELFDSLLYGIDGNVPDTYFLLKDYADYTEAQEKIDQLYRNKKKWSTMALHNIARCGKFSSDRTIHEYATQIWNIKSLNR
ncbi:MAG: glycogen/starch/alpha-glucan phosphorylase [Brevinema sp.]